MADGDTLTLDGVPAAGRRVQKYIHQVVVQKVDLVHVQNAAVGLGQQAWLESLDAWGVETIGRADLVQ